MTGWIPRKSKKRIENAHLAQIYIFAIRPPAEKNIALRRRNKEITLSVQAMYGDVRPRYDYSSIIDLGSDKRISNLTGWILRKSKKRLEKVLLAQIYIFAIRPPAENNIAFRQRSKEITLSPQAIYGPYKSNS